MQMCYVCIILHGGDSKIDGLQQMSEHISVGEKLQCTHSYKQVKHYLINSLLQVYLKIWVQVFTYVSCPYFDKCIGLSLLHHKQR